MDIGDIETVPHPVNWCRPLYRWHGEAISVVYEVEVQLYK